VLITTIISRPISAYFYITARHAISQKAVFFIQAAVRA
jgi:hypothetical protein